MDRPIITIDFETQPIEPRPDYPPQPVGVALIPPGGRPTYLAWGHPTGNSATFSDGRSVIRKAWDSRGLLLFHNAAFDVEVAMEAFGVPMPDPERVRDTLVEAFLFDPNAGALNLKALAEVHLNRLPEERTALHAWLDAHVPEAKRTKFKGRFISLAPGDLVGRYAVADVVMTLGLHRHFAPVIDRIDPARKRESALLPVLLGMEREGVPISGSRLVLALRKWEGQLERADAWLKKQLRMSGSIDQREEVADALLARRLVESFVLTEKGNRSTSKENLLGVIKDPMIASTYAFRSKLATSIRTFARPWLDSARKNDGRLFVRWNPVRTSHDENGRGIGARTGRLSSNPNVQNIPVRLPKIVTRRAEFTKLKASGEDVILLPPEFAGFELPNLRDFVQPHDRDWVILDGDFSQQELKILAHYERGEMMRAYLADPKLDLHAHAQRLLNQALGTNFGRKPVKNVGFAVIYGTGAGHLAEMILTDVTTARRVRHAYRTRVFPGLAKLDAVLKGRAMRNELILTRGGRPFRVEPPRLVQGRVRTFEYKLINTLIQGSAADMIKESMIEYARLGGLGRLLLSVHDELVVACPRASVKDEIERLREAGRALPFDVPIGMDFSFGPTWARLKEVR